MASLLSFRHLLSTIWSQGQVIDATRLISVLLYCFHTYVVGQQLAVRRGNCAALCAAPGRWLYTLHWHSLSQVLAGSDVTRMPPFLARNPSARLWLSSYHIQRSGCIVELIQAPLLSGDTSPEHNICWGQFSPTLRPASNSNCC